jgi:hypothetical protein
MHILFDSIMSCFMSLLDYKCLTVSLVFPGRDGNVAAVDPKFWIRDKQTQWEPRSCSPSPLGLGIHALTFNSKTQIIGVVPQAVLVPHSCSSGDSRALVDSPSYSQSFLPIRVF